MAKNDAKKSTGSNKSSLITRDFTINLHKRLHGVGAKKRAPRALKEIMSFAKSAMFTSDVRVSSSVNKAVWAKGVKAVPARLRVRLSRKRNEAADDKEGDEKGAKLYTLVEFVPTKDFKGLQTEKVNYGGRTKHRPERGRKQNYNTTAY